MPGATRFLRALGAEVQEPAAEGTAWASHHVTFPAVTEGFDADLDSPPFAARWGGLPDDFTGVLVNLRADDRKAVDAAVERGVAFGAQVSRHLYDAFWGVRYAVVRGPGPIIVGIMTPADEASRGEAPAVSDFA